MTNKVLVDFRIAFLQFGTVYFNEYRLLVD